MRVYRLGRPALYWGRPQDHTPTQWEGDYDRDSAATAGMVFEPDLPEAIWTGLLDPAGEPIYAYNNRRPIGYKLSTDEDEESDEE